MAYSRLPMKDPRTVAREIPSIFNIIFPQLTQGVVGFFNRKAKFFNHFPCIQTEDVQSSTLKPAMLFEIAVARGEQILRGNTVCNWQECLDIAIHKQRNHFDAKIPDKITEFDLNLAEKVAQNLHGMIKHINSTLPKKPIVHSPEIPGYQWIMSGNGDFAIGSSLIEVKCIARHFGAADYRQVLMYWLLSYAAAIENNRPEWKKILLLNPRRLLLVELTIDEIIEVAAAGKSKVEILELFSSIVGDFALKSLPEFKF